MCTHYMKVHVPQPGGPYNNNPRTGVKPSNCNSSASKHDAVNDGTVVVVVQVVSMDVVVVTRSVVSVTGRMTLPSKTRRTIVSICGCKPPMVDCIPSRKASFRRDPDGNMETVEADAVGLLVDVALFGW